MIRCPICGERKEVQVERKMNGKSACLKCGHKAKTSEFRITRTENKTKGQ